MNKNKIKKKISNIAALMHHRQMIPIPKLTHEKAILNNKVALITGGTGGLGRSFAEAFIECGCSVIISGRNDKKLQEIASSMGNACKYIVLDVTDFSSFENKVMIAEKLFSQPIDILVNAAGVHNNYGFLETEIDEYETIMKTNLEGCYFLSKAVAKRMIEHKIKGHILNVSSSAALRPAWTPYQISKWGIRGLTLGMADVLLPYGIIVNAIAPGPTATEMLVHDENSLYKADSLIGRYEHPIEISNLAQILVSDIGNMIVGDTIYVTGGSGVISYHR